MSLLLSNRHPVVHTLALQSSPATVRVLFAGLLLAPALLLVTRWWWVGPLALAALLAVVSLLAWRDRRALPEERTMKTSWRTRGLELVAVLLVYGATLWIFRSNFDIWEQWTWTMHTDAPWDGFESQTIPPVAQVLRDQPGRWHGPHITHGLMH